MKIDKTKIMLAVLTIALCLTACKQGGNKRTNPNEKLSAESSRDNLKDFYLKYVEAANSRDFETISNMINDDVVLKGKPSKKEESIAGFKQVISTFPDHKWHIEDLFIDGDRIAVRLRNTGTPKKTTSFGKNPNEISVEYTEYASYKVVDGKFIEMWYLIDDLGIREQLIK
ncbi:ester cyclase [Fulvivirga sp.]|uniref:ester cyclase n=1 Tax=Fulvivirga sp. TaxID=1931237 RepID=UPI0032EAE804